MSKFEATAIVGVVNDTVTMAEDFVDGKPFTLELSNKIMKTFDLEHELDSDQVFEHHVGMNYMEMSERLGHTHLKREKKPNVYLQYLETAKNIIKQHQPTRLGKDICYIATDISPSKLMVALITRYLNIVHKCKYIIVLNDEIVYVPTHLRSRDKDEFGRYVKLAILSHKDQTKTKLVKGLKKNTRYLASQMTKTVVTA
ncbi:hypothetical protein [Flavobacterium sp.]|uniref:hypothetical protein n=1 Tax=Flavobacterium sp. TaxID=239 RepID=UPI0037BF1AAF